MLLLIPFADLGTGAAVTSAVAEAEHPHDDPLVRDTLLAALRVLAVVSVFLMVLAFGLHRAETWRLLHLAPDLPASQVSSALSVALALYALNLPLALWLRIYIGLGLNKRVILLNGLAPIILLLAGSASLAIKAPLWVLVSSLFASQLLISIFAWMWLIQSEALPVAHLIRSLPHRRLVPGAAILRTAGPMLVISVAQPLAVHTDRLLLNWRSDAQAVASYSLGAQLYLPLLSILSTGAAGLWPHFSRSRREKTTSFTDVRRLTLGIGAFGFALAILLVVAGSPLARWVAEGEVSVSLTVFASFALLLIAQSLTFPAAMYLTDAAGLAFQAKSMVLLLVVNLAVSYTLARYGPEGPVLASAASILVCQTLPGLLRIKRSLSGHSVRSESGSVQTGSI